MDNVFLEATEMLSLLATELRRDRPIASGTHAEVIAASAESAGIDHEHLESATQPPRIPDDTPLGPWAMGPHKLRDIRGMLDGGARPHLARPYRRGARRPQPTGHR